MSYSTQAHRVTPVNNYLTGLFQYYRWLDGGKVDDNARRQAINSLQEWEKNWRRYNEAIPALTGVASLYKDAGMSQAAHDALRDMGK